MDKPTNEELVYMSQDEIEKYSRSTNDITQLKKLIIIADHKLAALKEIVSL